MSLYLDASIKSSSWDFKWQRGKTGRYDFEVGSELLLFLTGWLQAHDHVANHLQCELQKHHMFQKAMLNKSDAHR